MKKIKDGINTEQVCFKLSTSSGSFINLYIYKGYLERLEKAILNKLREGNCSLKKEGGTLIITPKPKGSKGQYKFRLFAEEMRHEGKVFYQVTHSGLRK